MLKSGRIKNFLGFAVSLVLIVWLVFAVSWREVYTHFLQINYWVTIPGLITLMLHFYLRAYRWRFLLPRTEKPAGIRTLFDAVMMGNFATYVLPLRAGEFIRPMLLSQNSEYSFAAGFASVVVERFFDLAVVLLTFAYVITQVEGLPDWAKSGALVLGSLSLGILAFIIAGALLPEFLLKWTGKILSFLPERIKSVLMRFIGDILESAKVVSNLRNFLRIVVLSAAVWLANYASLYIFMFIFPGDYSFLMALTLAVVVALAVAAPSAPGFLGVYQTACIAGYQIFGLSKEMAVTFSIVTHLLNYILFGIFALHYLLTKKTRLSDLMQRSRTAEK